MDTLRICTWNIKQGIYLQRVLREIALQKDFKKLDFLALQECALHKGIDDAHKIADLLGPEYRYYQANIKLKTGRLQGNAFIWNEKRLKITRMESFFLPDMHGDHLPRWEKMFLKFTPKQDRICLILEGKFGKKSIKIYVTHLDVLGFTHKRAQLNAIFAHERQESPSDLCCIVGDFNTFKFVRRPSWKNLSEDARTFGFHDLTTEIFWTFATRSVRFKQKLDSIFLKPYNFKYHSWALDIHGSDHIPIFCNIRM